MEPAEFKRVLEIGLGRAILHSQTHAITAYRDVILETCLHCPTYDAQIDPRSARYLFEIIELTGDTHYYRDPILAALATSSAQDDKDTYQLFALAKFYAQRGDLPARHALYDKAANNLQQGEFTGASDVIELDGLEGLVFVAEQIGDAFALPEIPIKGTQNYAVDENNIWLCNVQVKELEEEYGEEVWEVLRQAAVDKPQTKRFIERLRAFREANTVKSTVNYAKDSAVSYRHLKALITLDEQSFPFWKWGQEATGAELLQAAHDLLAESDTQKLIRYLRIFSKRAFPLPPEKLISLTTSSEDRLAANAFSALEQIAHPAVRALALERLSVLEVWRSVGLLIRNFQPGDYRLITNLTERELTPDQYHDIGLDLLHMLEKRPDPDAGPALINLYEKGPCTRCRERFVETLYTLHQLPNWIIEECRYDANFELRTKANSAFTPSGTKLPSS